MRSPKKLIVCTFQATLVISLLISSCGKYSMYDHVTGKVAKDIKEKEDKIKAQAKLEAENKAKVLNAIENKMIKVDGGIFEMGVNNGGINETPVHKVTLSSFYIGKYELTQAEYQAIMGINPSYFKGTNLPVERVSFHEAVEFCNKYNKAKGLPNAYDASGNIINFTSYRLPTEAEWEYAARGGNKSQGYKYSGSNNTDEVAWYGSNSGSKTHEVGTKKANELGIYDMSGNVWEWCSDWYSNSYYVNSQLSNPYNNKSAIYRVSRGGSWYEEYKSFFEVPIRNFGTPSFSYNYVLGFRLVRTIN